MSTEGPESKQAELRVLQGVMMILSTVAIGLRIQSRRVSSAGWGWDDIFAVVTWVRGADSLSQISQTDY